MRMRKKRCKNKQNPELSWQNKSETSEKEASLILYSVFVDINED
jgi:hypothetical protein